MTVTDADQRKQEIDDAVGEDLLYCDGLDDALIGFVERFGMDPVALYDRAKIIRIYVERDGMTEEEAEEFFAFNVIGAWVGEGAPAFATLLD